MIRSDISGQALRNVLYLLQKRNVHFPQDDSIALLSINQILKSKVFQIHFLKDNQLLFDLFRLTICDMNLLNMRNLISHGHSLFNEFDCRYYLLVIGLIFILNKEIDKSFRRLNEMKNENQFQFSMQRLPHSKEKNRINKELYSPHLTLNIRPNLQQTLELNKRFVFEQFGTIKNYEKELREELMEKKGLLEIFPELDMSISMLFHLIENEKFYQCLFLFFPVVENFLRHFYCKWNCVEEKKFAKIGERFITLHTMLSIERDNQFLESIPEGLIMLLFDMLVHPDGLRIRDRIFHGEYPSENVNDTNYLKYYELTIWILTEVIRSVEGFNGKLNEIISNFKSSLLPLHELKFNIDNSFKLFNSISREFLVKSTTPTKLLAIDCGKCLGKYLTDKMKLIYYDTAILNDLQFILTLIDNYKKSESKLSERQLKNFEKLLILIDNYAFHNLYHLLVVIYGMYEKMNKYEEMIIPNLKLLNRIVHIFGRVKCLSKKHQWMELLEYSGNINIDEFIGMYSDNSEDFNYG
ncbi:hypothetical protein SNEBB_007953 [Seison nebaliae]|nr:hypothetical protein SNEBB_007953 [Seison nebaliae]